MYSSVKRSHSLPDFQDTGPHSSYQAVRGEMSEQPVLQGREKGRWSQAEPSALAAQGAAVLAHAMPGPAAGPVATEPVATERVRGPYC